MSVRHRYSWAAFAVMLAVIVWQGTVLTRSQRDASDSRQHLNFLVGAAPVAIITTDDRGNVDTFNPQAAVMFGYTAEEMHGKPVHDLVAGMPAADHERVMEAAAARLRQKPEDWEQSRACIPSRAKRKDGSEFSVLVTVRGIMVSGKIHFVAFIAPSPYSAESRSEGPLKK